MKDRIGIAIVLSWVAGVSGQQPAERWWSHVTFLANDSMKGRDSGSPERRKPDQYSFIKTGVPALSFKVGFTKDSREHRMVKRWRTGRYHAPSDDLNQPIDRKSAEDFGKVYQAVVAEVANRPTRPQWNKDSFFERFAK